VEALGSKPSTAKKISNKNKNKTGGVTQVVEFKHSF
jgi:hypothetical protein